MCTVLLTRTFVMESLNAARCVLHQSLMSNREGDARINICLHAVNNTGSNIRGQTAQFALADYDTVMATNLTSAFHMCQVSSRGSPDTTLSRSLLEWLHMLLQREWHL